MGSFTVKYLIDRTYNISSGIEDKAKLVEFLKHTYDNSGFNNFKTFIENPNRCAVYRAASSKTTDLEMLSQDEVIKLIRESGNKIVWNEVIKGSLRD